MRVLATRSIRRRRHSVQHLLALFQATQVGKQNLAQLRLDERTNKRRRLLRESGRQRKRRRQVRVGAASSNLFKGADDHFRFSDLVNDSHHVLARVVSASSARRQRAPQLAHQRDVGVLVREQRHQTLRAIAHQ